MASRTVTSREFNQDTSKAKRSAAKGPVFITDRGEPSHVLLSIRDYRALLDGGSSIVDRLGMDDAADIEFDPPKLDSLIKPAGLR